jgi:hypothetical protein
MPKSNDLIEALVKYVATLKNKAYDVEMARQKVTTDVEKLIRNQETFEKRVSEMDQVYRLLNSEQRKLKDRKHAFNEMVREDGKQGSLS